MIKQNKKNILGKINQVFIDIFIFICSYFSAFLIRFEGIPDPISLKRLLILLPYIALARLLSFYIFSIYSIVWRYISINDAISIFKACLPVTGILFLGRIFLPDKLAQLKIPLSVIALEFLLVLLGTLGVRMTRRVLSEFSEKGKYENNGVSLKKKKTLLIGAGDAGNMVVKELKHRTDLGYKVVGFIDDNSRKINTVIQGIKVLGNTSQIPEIVKKLNIDEAIITIANASSKEIRRIVDICKKTNIRVKIVPGLFEILGEKIKISKIREVNIDDLLGRSIVTFKNYLPEIINHYKNKKILVTGAGGSIGSELCRQLAILKPKELILIDKDENSIFEIDSELKYKLKEYKIIPFISDIRNFERLRYIFEKYRPDIIFHAAAHKHVPLMEYNVSEAILNNVSGTRNVALLSDLCGVRNFIFISTDKAVNPTSVMGASKKIGEILIQELASKSDTNFSCVRFGNVLGSRGSVVPLFQKQIAQGGPITITHHDMQRYFMSISEAVQLIIQAGTIGNRGEIFVLDMGELIKIEDLAKDLIKLSGFAEDDFEIKYTGLRPGEKLFEEILVDEERSKVTKFEKIFISAPIEIDNSKFSEKLNELLNAAGVCNEIRIIECLKNMGIGYNNESREEKI
jgi:FlaA1/EpsC-like NDP-sugar epimerase